MHGTMNIKFKNFIFSSFIPNILLLWVNLEKYVRSINDTDDTYTVHAVCKPGN